MICTRLFARDKSVRHRRGWILIDSLAAITILTVGILAAMAAFTQTTRSAAYGDAATTATYLAQQSLEKLKYYDGKTIAPVLPDTATSGIFTITCENDAATKGLLPMANLNVQPVRVTVSWQDLSNQTTRLIVLSSYYFHYD